MNGLGKSEIRRMMTDYVQGMDMDHLVLNYQLPQDEIEHYIQYYAPLYGSREYRDIMTKKVSRDERSILRGDLEEFIDKIPELSLEDKIKLYYIAAMKVNPDAAGVYFGRFDTVAMSALLDIIGSEDIGIFFEDWELQDLDKFLNENYVVGSSMTAAGEMRMRKQLYRDIVSGSNEDVDMYMDMEELRSYAKSVL